MAKENRSRKAIIESRRRRRLILLTVTGFFLVYFIFSFTFGDAGLLSYFKMKRTKQELVHDIEQLHQRNTELRYEIEWLRSDPRYIEQMARERLGLVKDGEIIYQFNDTP